MYKIALKKLKRMIPLNCLTKTGKRKKPTPQWVLGVLKMESHMFSPRAEQMVASIDQQREAGIVKCPVNGCIEKSSIIQMPFNLNITENIFTSHIEPCLSEGSRYACVKGHVRIALPDFGIAFHLADVVDVALALVKSIDCQAPVVGRILYFHAARS